MADCFFEFMKAVIQRVRSAKVTINDRENRSIGPGGVVLLGIENTDTDTDLLWMIDKILNLRIFANDQGKFDKSVLDITGELMVVSQFTLFADCRKGRRPDFTAAAKPELAVPMYQKFVEEIKSAGCNTVTGEFGATMLVEIHNDGPVTIILDSKQNK